MQKKKDIHILIVDDEIFNLKVIEEYLSFENYKISTAENGLLAWQMLEQSPYEYDIVLLDRMMPEMDGMEVLKKIKAHPILQYCPVIFQTAKISKNNILEGLNSGAFYYLTKPFDEDMLLSVVKTASRDRQQQIQLFDELGKTQAATRLMTQGKFKFQSIEDVNALATLLSYIYPEPKKMALGLYELLMNAVEHGNLAISYDDKTQLNKQNLWESEINRRLSLDENKEKFATVILSKVDNEVVVTIADSGDGFDHHAYMDFDPVRIMDNHGRGIAMANKLCFNTIQYNDKGNQVSGYFKLENESDEENNLNIASNN